jgi:hypothetical protein
MTPERRKSGARETAVAMERLGKHTLSATAGTSRNNRAVAGSGVAKRSGAKQKVSLLRNTSYYVTYINRGTVFSVGSVQNLYLDCLERSLREILQADRPVRV